MGDTPPINGTPVFTVAWFYEPSTGNMYIYRGTTLGWYRLSTGGGGGGNVNSVFGRTGNVVASGSDYAAFYLSTIAGIAAGGDLSGTYPNPTVSRLNGQLPAYYLSRANQTGTQAANTITGLATVATSGAYGDLTGKPTIYAFTGSSVQYTKGDGTYATFPTVISFFTNDAGYITGNQTITLSGDVTGSGANGIVTALSTVNTNVGTFGSSTTVPVITVDGKGRITAVGTATIATGTTYTAGTGLTLTGSVFALNLTYTDGRYEVLSNKVTTLTNSNTQYPSTSAVTTALGGYVDLVNAQTIGGNKTFSGTTGTADLTTNGSTNFNGTNNFNNTAYFRTGNTLSFVAPTGTPSYDFTNDGTGLNIANHAGTGLIKIINGTIQDGSGVFFLKANQTITLSGDITGSGSTAIVTTLATVNTNVGSFGGSTTVPVITVNAKGLITAVSTATITTFTNPMTTINDIIIGGSSGTPARLGIGSSGQVLTYNGTNIVWTSPTGLTNPMTTLGDIITGGASGSPTRLGIGSTNQVLTVISGVPTWSTPSGGTSFANPTALIGLTAVNGSATTAMRSDGAPALDQTIAPTWTGLHTFLKTGLAATAVNSVLLQNTTASTSSVFQNSPAAAWQGNGWGTTAGASQPLLFQAYAVPASGTTVTGNWTMYSTRNGGTPKQMFSWDVDGNLTLNPNGSITTTFGQITGGALQISNSGFFGSYVQMATLASKGTNTPLAIQGPLMNAAGTAIPVTLNGSVSNTSGQFNFLNATVAYNQTSGTASNTDFSLYRTQTAVGSGLQLLFDLGVGTQTAGASGVFAITSAGNIRVNNTALTSGQGIVSNGTTMIPATLQVAFPFQTITTATNASVNNRYYMNGSTRITLTLPTTAAVNDVIYVVGVGVGGWTVAQNAGQVIHGNSSDTTTGTGGSLASTYKANCVELRCVVANTDFTIINSNGSITVN